VQTKSHIVVLRFPVFAIRVAALLFIASISMTAQRGGSQGIPNSNTGPYNVVGPDAAFAQIESAQMYMDKVAKHSKESARQRAQEKELIDSGAISTLDLEAPNSAIDAYNHANSLLKAQHSKEAIDYLRRAIDFYPKFVSAYVALGLAYVDQDQTGLAKMEFETAAKLDEKYPGSFLNLGLLALSTRDFAAAQLQLVKASSLNPNARNLSALAYAQNGAREYQHALETAQRVHSIEH